MRHYLIFLFLLIRFAAWGQNIKPTEKQVPYFSIHSIKESSYEIPVLTHAQQPATAEKINHIIQMQVIRKSHKVAGKKFFSEMKDETGYGTMSLGYQILTNNHSIFSIVFHDETVSAYPDYHTYYYTFNSATGEIISLEELFTTAGLKHLKNHTNSIFNENIKRNYQNFWDELSEVERQDQVDYLFQLTECNANHEILKFGVRDTDFLVEKDRCFPHVIQAHDVSWSCEVPFKKLYSDDLSEAGKTLLVEKQPFKSTTSHLNKEVITLHGKIDGKYSFNMYLERSGDLIRAEYWYTKFGNVIDLGGEITEHGIELQEADGKFIISLNSNNTLSGAWYDKDEKAHPITFD